MSWRDRARRIIDSHEYEVKALDGKTTIGTVGYDAYKAINDNTVSSYIPKNEEERKTINAYKAIYTPILGTKPYADMSGEERWIQSKRLSSARLGILNKQIEDIEAKKSEIGTRYMDSGELYYRFPKMETELAPIGFDAQNEPPAAQNEDERKNQFTSVQPIEKMETLNKVSKLLYAPATFDDWDETDKIKYAELEEQKKAFLEVEEKTKYPFPLEYDGKSCGNVGFGAIEAFENGTIESYRKNADAVEKKAIDAYIAAYKKKHKAGPVKWVASNMWAGTTSVTKSAAWLLDKTIGWIPGVGYATDWLREGTAQDNADAKRWAANANYTRGGVWEWVGENILQPIGATLPQTIAAVISGSMIAPASLGTTSAMTSLTTPQILSNAVQGWAKSPSYWMSFASTIGSEYEAAKANGASDAVAAATATLTTMLNAGIETNSGLETLWPKLLDEERERVALHWVKSMVEEGGEEVLQGFVSNGIAKLSYLPEAPLVSLADENAAINPVRAAKEFGGGVMIGGILGGVKIPAAKAVNAYRNSTPYRNKKMGAYINSKPELAKGILTAGSQISNQTAQNLVLKAKKDGKLSNRDMGELFYAVQNAVQQYETAPAHPSNTFGENGQKAFETNYREEQDAGVYTQGFNQFYRRGFIGQDYKTAENETQGTDFGKVMSADQKTSAYYAGVNDAKISLKRQKNNVRFVKTYGKESGVVDNDIARTYDAEVIKTVDRFAKAVGAKVEFVDTIEGGTVNGSIEDGYIQIAKDADNPVSVIIGHEITHRMQQLAPEAYASYRNYVVQTNPKLVDMVANAYKTAGYNIWGGAVDGTRFSRKIDGNSKVGYNKREGSVYDEYSTNAMIWARSTSTNPGDMKILNANGKYFALIQAMEDGFIELAKGGYKEIEARYERIHSEKDRSIYEDTQEIRSEQNRNMWDLQYAEDGGYAAGDGEQTGSQGLQTDAAGNNEHLRSGNQGKSVKYSLKEASDTTTGKTISGGAVDGTRFSRKIDKSGTSGYTKKYDAREMKQLREYIMQKNFSSDEILAVGCKEIGNNFYIWENLSKDTYNVARAIKIDGNEDLINDLRGMIEDGSYRTASKLGEALNRGSRNGRGSSSGNNAVREDRRSTGGTGRVSSGQSESNTVGRSSESNGNSSEVRTGRGVKYSLKETSDTATGKTISWEAILDEAAAEYTGYILNSPETINQFIDDARSGKLIEGGTTEQNMNVVKRLWQSIKNFIEKVKKLFKGDKKAQDKAAKDAFGMPMSELEKARDLLGKAFVESEKVVNGKKEPSQSAEQTAPPKGSHTSSVSEADSSLKEGAEERVKYSLKKHFNQQVDEVLDKKLNSGYHVYVGKTSHWLVKCGFDPDLPMLMTQKHIRDINHEKTPDNIHYHGLEPELIKQIPNELADPVMIYDSITPELADRENAVCVVTKLKDGDKLPIIISVKANQVGDAKYYDVTLETQKLKEKNDDKFNLVASEYGRNNFFEHINDVIMQDALLYANKKKTLKLFSDRGLQLPTRLNSLGFDKIIHQSRNIVNPYSMQKSEKDVSDSKKSTPSVSEADSSLKEGVEGKVKYSLKKHFNQQVDEALDKTLKRGYRVYVGKTSSWLAKCGFNPEIPLLMNPSHIRDINHEKSPDNIHYHGLKPELIKQIPNELQNPVMIYDSITPEVVERENAVCVVTKLKDGDGLPIIISVKANETDGAKYYDVTLETVKTDLYNFVASEYGKDDFFEHIENIIMQDALLYANKKKTLKLFSDSGLQLPTRLNSLGFDKIIHQSRNIVNPYSMQKSEKDVSDSKKSTPSVSVADSSLKEGAEKKDGDTKPEREYFKEAERDLNKADDMDEAKEKGEDYFKEPKDSEDSAFEEKDKGSKKYSIKLGKDVSNLYDYTKSFEEQIEDFKKGKIPQNDTLLVGGTPKVLQKIGFNALPITINQEHVDYILNNTKDEDHYLGETFLKKLPELLEDPLAVIEDFGHDNRLTVLVKYAHHINKKPIIVPIEIDGYGTINNVSIDSNAITTAFAKGGILDTFQNVLFDIEKGGQSLFYWNKKEALTLLQTLGRQLPNHLPQDGLLHSIRENGTNVNPRFENVTKSQQFIRFFGDWIKNPKRASKIVNKDGTPMIVYHQTGEDFTVFSTKNEKAGKYDSETPIGYFFKPTDEDIGLEGKKQMAVYLNMRRPLLLSDRIALSEYWKKNIKGYAESLTELETLEKQYTEKISEAEAKEDADYQTLWEKWHSGEITEAEYEKAIEVSDAENLQQEWNKRDNALRRKMKKAITEYMANSNHDGVILKNDAGANGKTVETYIVFEPTQIKSATDNIGTFDASNPDIRYSLKMDDVLKQNATLKKAYTQLRAEYAKLQNGKKVADTKRIASVVKNLLDESDFAYSSTKLTEQFENLTAEAQAIFEGKMDFETFRGKVKEIAESVIAEGTRHDSVVYQESKKLRDYLRTTKISLNAEEKANLGDDYETIRKSTFGRLRLVKEGGLPIDIAYQEMSVLFPEHFSEETEVGGSAQLLKIVEVLDGLQLVKNDPFEGYADEAADWLSGMMIDRIFNEVFVSGSTGKVDISVDMKALRESMGDNLQNIMNRERIWRTKEYDKLQKQFEKKTKNYTESRQKAIKIKQVKLHTERISKALVNPSERFAVPEDLKKPVAEFLQCIDLTSDRMGDKAREQLGDLMAAYKAMAEQEYELNMVIDPDLYNNLQDISDSIKALDTKNKRLSDLSLATLEKLRNAVMAMEASLRNYNRAFREGKAIQIDALAEAAVAEIKELRKGNKKNSKIWGGASDLMNFDMLNPFDYFHQMGGTFEGLFMGLREGENVQIRDLALAKNNLDKQMEAFGIDPNKLSGKKAKAQEFKLANGETVEFTKAQVMSLYLLWRQNASHEHILEGGFRPGEVQQKLIEKKGEDSKVVLKVSEDYSSVRPSLDDVAKILDTLSDNEKKFAESVSQFFTEECAEWGNEVAMKLYGYKKFNTPNYFPIVSDKMYLQEDFGVSADSTIKNTGFTKKRVKHANNPVIIEDIFEVYARHTSDMAKYHGYVLPLQDIQRVFNHVSRGDFVETSSVSYDDSFLYEGARSEGFISSENVKIIQDIGRKSVNNFTSEDFKKTEKLADRYFKEMGKKSPFYRAEYGDWRENDNTVVETIRLQDNQDDVRGVITNKDTSIEINVSKIGIDHIKVHLHNSELSSFVTKNLKEIAEKSILLDSFVSEPTGKTKHKNSVMLHSFYVPIEFKGKKSVAKLYVEEFFNDWNKSVQRRVYDLKEIEVLNDADRFGEISSTPLYASKTTSIHTVSDLFNVVKKNDNSFNPKSKMNTKKEVIPVNNTKSPALYVQNGRDQTSDRSVSQESGSINTGLREGESLKALIASRYGRKAVTYFSKLMNDINAGIKNEYGNAFASKMVSQYKKAKMGANVRVVIQQPMSYIRAAALIDPKYLAAASGHGVDLELVYKYSPIAQWKDWGFFSIDTGKSMYDLMTGKTELSDYTMALAGKADQMTWKKLWNAVERETADLHPELPKGSEKFYQAVGKRFDYVIDRTQVVDSTLHRSQILRSPDNLTKMSVSFMSEPMKTYNLLRTAVSDAVMRGDKKGLARTVAVAAISSILLACVTGGYDTLTGEEDEEFWTNFTDNLIGDYTGMIPYVKDIASIIQGYDVKRMDVQSFGDVINAVKMFASDRYTLQYKVANMAMKTADLFGVPASSFKRSVYDTVVRNIFRGMDNYWLDYNLAKQMYPVNGKMKGEFIDILFEAYKSGDKEQYDKIFVDMMKEGIDAKSIENGLKSRYKNSGIEETFSVPWNNKTEIPKQESEDKFGIDNLTNEQYMKYYPVAVELEEAVVGDIKSLKGEFDEETYDAMLSAAYDYVENVALEKTAPNEYDFETEWILNALEAEVKYGIAPADFIRYREEYGIKSSNLEKFGEIENSGIGFVEYLEFKDFFGETKGDKDANGKTIKNSKQKKVVNYLNSMNLTDEEWDALFFEVAGYKK